MIFITIGTQEPFDRLIKAIDELAPQIDEEIIAQAPNTTYKPVNFALYNFIEPIEFNEIFERSSLVVSHAGMGTIISALRTGKPLIVMPRLVSLKEHRNDHQIATATKLDSLGYVHVAYNETDLKVKILEFLKSKATGILARKLLGDDASPKLIESIKEFINESK